MALPRRDRRLPTLIVSESKTTQPICASSPRLQAATIHSEGRKCMRRLITEGDLQPHPTSGAPLCSVIKKEQERGREAETMRCPNPDEEPAVKMVILSDNTAAKSQAIRWARAREAKVGAGVWMWRMDGSRSNDGRVGAAAARKHRDGWRAFRSHLGTEQMEVYDAELWAIGLTLWESVKRRDTLQTHRLTKVAVLSNSHAPI